MSRKTEIYTWRLTRTLKVGLEEAARREGRTIAQLLDEIVTKKLEALESEPEEDDRQRQLHARAADFAGCLRGTDPNRGQNARALARARLKKRTSVAT